ncbi:MAG: 2-octaprenyl-6-methoxyphenyl hydroxylase [Gammaproteobacteria bacterium]|nr:2-octaprenyl-6-methoxyphenyl hydroxylase [Gammaproteobacteria bacterium]|tara:strand:+ start:659 stop:1951 length:1293 start_codon:yes stop_codon:yes gene_type:complete
MTGADLKPEYDIVIAGGGLVGSSFALLLDRLAQGSDLSVLLLDAASPPADSDDQSADFDARSTALSWGSRLIYEQAGLWPALASDVTAIRDIHVSDKGHFGATRLNSTEMGVEALGYVAENRHLGRVLQQALRDHKRLTVCAPASVEHVQPSSDGVMLTLKGAGRDTVSARLLVLADGGRSGLCRQLGIAVQQKRYGQQALICNVAFANDHHGQAFERFTDTGPLAMLPLADHVVGRERQHRGALVWTLADVTEPKSGPPMYSAERILALPEAEFIEALQQRFGWRLGRITHAGARSLYPLSLNLAREQIRPGIVLLGNVAHTLHPVAGQGLNLALRDARALAELLVEAHRERRHPGAMDVLQAFVAAQSGDQLQTITFSDVTTRLFSNAQPALALGRNLGLLLMDLMPPAKGWFARQAMGMADRHDVRF